MPRKDATRPQPHGVNHAVIGIVLGMAGLLLLCALLTCDPKDLPGVVTTAPNNPLNNWIGPVGARLGLWLFLGLWLDRLHDSGPVDDVRPGLSGRVLVLFAAALDLGGGVAGLLHGTGQSVRGQHPLAGEVAVASRGAVCRRVGRPVLLQSRLELLWQGGRQHCFRRDCISLALST